MATVEMSQWNIVETLGALTVVAGLAEDDSVVDKADLWAPRQRSEDTSLVCELPLAAQFHAIPSSAVGEMVALQSDSYGPRVGVVERTVVAVKDRRMVALARFLRGKK